MLIALKDFATDESGATAIEYGLIAMLIAVGIVVSVTALGSSLKAIFDSVAAQVVSATG